MKLFGSSIIILSTEICLTSLVLSGAEAIKMTGAGYAWILGLESSALFNNNTFKIVKNVHKDSLEILNNGLIGITP